MPRAALAAVCAPTLLATVYLTISLITLAPPAANCTQWAAPGLAYCGAVPVFAPAPAARSLKFKTALNSMLNSPKFCHR
jgi:hypothetical protein